MHSISALRWQSIVISYIAQVFSCYTDSVEPVNELTPRKPTGRPRLSPDEKRSMDIRIALSQAEYQRLKAWADHARRPLARYVRDVALASCGPKHDSHDG